MDSSSYLNPENIKAQCESAVHTLQNDNDALYKVGNSLDVFINDGEIKSSAFDTLKQQISDYQTIIQAMKTANDTDIADYETLECAIGNELLDGALIIEQKKNAEAMWKNNEQKAEEYRQKVYSDFLIIMIVPKLGEYYMAMATYYSAVAYSGKLLYELWKRKEESYDEIENATSNLFAASEGMRAAIAVGISDITGAFQNGIYMPDMRSGWRAKVVEETKKIKEYRALNSEKYGHYLEEYPEDLQKVIDIMDFENENSEVTEKVDAFLASLELQDIIGIKSIAYKADEPYRKLWFKYLDRYEITDTTRSGVFYSDSKTLVFDVAKDRDNPRGKYYTFFHECGHAIDYFYGQDQGEDWYSGTFRNDVGESLSDTIIEDVRNNVSVTINDILSNHSYDSWTMQDKETAKINVLNNIMAQNTLTITDNERIIQNQVIQVYDNILSGPTNNVASDMYSGVTNFTFQGDYSHKNSKDKEGTYWFYNDGTVRRLPNKECFAEYYSYCVIRGDEAKKSMESYLPKAKKTIEQMIQNME